MVSRMARRHRHRLLVLPLVLAWGTAAAPILGQAAPPTNAAPPDLVVLPIRLLDTSGEPEDQSAAHAARLAVMARDLVERLGSDGRMSATGLSADALAGACPDTDAGCILSQARRTGAPLAFVGVVHKSSTLIMQMFAWVVDTASGETRVSRELNFRGDTDESWQRMTAFLAREIGAAERGTTGRTKN